MNAWERIKELEAVIQHERACMEAAKARIAELERVQGVLVGALDYYATGDFGTSCGVAVDALAAIAAQEAKSHE